jgi:WD40 repeat protein
MKMRIKGVQILLLLANFTWYGLAFSSNLNGTAAIVYKTQHHVFSDGESALGYVRMGGGFTTKPTAKATLDTLISVSGPIDLRETGELQLLKDLVLDSGVTWSSGGKIRGRGNAIILRGNLSIPASKVIHITDDTIIDGKGNMLEIGENSQIFVDHDVTLTMRNVLIYNKRNNPLNSCIKLASHRSMLAFDNSVLAAQNDFSFNRGHLFIHNDFVFTGTSAFIYTSPVASFVAPGSTLTFDVGTSFSFAPTSTTENIFILQDKSSIIYTNGISLYTTSSGMRLTTGRLLIDNKNDWHSKSETVPTSLTISTSRSYGSGVITSVDVSPGGLFLAVAGSSATAGGSSGFATTDELRIYRIGASTLTTVTSQHNSTQPNSVRWSPDGKFLALGKDISDGPVGDDDIYIYGFDGSFLTYVTSLDMGLPDDVQTVEWSPDGKLFSVAGQAFEAGFGGFADAFSIRTYTFNGQVLSPLVALDHHSTNTTGGQVNSLAWSPDGRFLAVGGSGAVSGAGGFANTHQLRIYSYDGTSFTALTSQSFGGFSASIKEVSWSPSGEFIALGGSGASSGGGFANNNNVRIYRFNGTSLSAVTSLGTFSDVRSIKWSPDGTTLAIGDPGTGLSLYRFTGTALSLVTSNATVAVSGQGITWHPSGKKIIVGGGGSTVDIAMNTVNQAKNANPQAYSRSIVFGNKNLTSSSNLGVEILGAAHITLDGFVSDESV